MIRRTPLKRSTKPIKRTLLKPWHRKPETKVTPELAAFVQDRDQGCVPAMLGAPGLCRTPMQTPIGSGQVHLMTLMHVHDGPTARAGVRAKSDRFHVAVGCFGHGVQSWELRNRDLLVLYLKHVQTNTALRAAELALREAGAIR